MLSVYAWKKGDRNEPICHRRGPDDIRHEIEEVEENSTLSDGDKAAILADNARRFYQT